MGTVGGQTCASLGVPFEYNVCRLAAGSLAKLVNNLDHSSGRMAAGVMPIGRGWLQKAKPSQNRGRNLDGVFSVAHRVHIRTRARPILTRILPFTSAYADSFLFSLPNSQVEFTAVGGQRIWPVRLPPFTAMIPIAASSGLARRKEIYCGVVSCGARYALHPRLPLQRPSPANAFAICAPARDPATGIPTTMSQLLQGLLAGSATKMISRWWLRIFCDGKRKVQPAVTRRRKPSQ